MRIVIVSSLLVPSFPTGHSLRVQVGQVANSASCDETRLLASSHVTSAHIHGGGGEGGTGISDLIYEQSLVQAGQSA